MRTEDKTTSTSKRALSKIFNLLQRLEVRYGSDEERCVGTTSHPLTAPESVGHGKSCQPWKFGNLSLIKGIKP